MESLSLWNRSAYEQYYSIPTRVTYHTLVDTSFKLISDFFHVNQGVLCCEHAEQASSSNVFEGGGGGGGATGLLNKGGGSNRLPVEFTD